MSKAIRPADLVGAYASYVEGQRICRGPVLRVSPDPGYVELRDTEAGMVTVPADGLAFEDEDRAVVYADTLARTLVEAFGASEDAAQDFAETLLPGDFGEFFDAGLDTEEASLAAAVDELLDYDLSAGTLRFREG